MYVHYNYTQTHTQLSKDTLTNTHTNKRATTLIVFVTQLIDVATSHQRSVTQVSNLARTCALNKVLSILYLSINIKM